MSSIVWNFTLWICGCTRMIIWIIKIVRPCHNGGQFKELTSTCFKGRFQTILSLALYLSSVTSAPPSSASLKKVHAILEKHPLIDTHNDLPWNLKHSLYGDLTKFKFNSDLKNNAEWKAVTPSEKHTDIPRLRAGGVGAQFWAAYVECGSQYKDAVEQTLEQIDVTKRLIQMNSDNMQFATSVADIKDSFAKKKIASLIGVEGGHSIQSSLGILRMFYELGVRYMTLTHNCNTPWADSWNDTVAKELLPTNNGLSEFGVKIVHEMNRLGMMVDVSHTSHATQLDALEHSKAPIIFSHTGIFAKCQKGRNAEDDVLELLGKKKGVAMISFYGLYARCDGQDSTIEDIIGHIEHARAKAGVDSIGFGGDFDGVDVLPKGLEDVSKYPDLLAALMDTGRWSEDDIAKIASKNVLRVFKAVEKVKKKLKGDLPIQEPITRAELEAKKADLSGVQTKFPGDKQ